MDQDNTLPHAETNQAPDKQAAGLSHYVPDEELLKHPYPGWYDWRSSIDKNQPVEYWLQFRESGIFTEVTALPTISLVEAPQQVRPHTLVGITFPEPWPAPSTPLILTMVMPAPALLVWAAELRRISNGTLDWRWRGHYAYYNSGWDGRWLRYTDERIGYVLFDLATDGREAFAICFTPELAAQLADQLEAFIKEPATAELASFELPGNFWMLVIDQ